MFEVFSTAELFGLLAFILGTAMMQFKDLRHIFIISVPKCLLWSLHFLLLDAYAGAITNFIAAIRSICRTYVGERYLSTTVIGSTIMIWIISLYFYLIK